MPNHTVNLWHINADDACAGNTYLADHAPTEAISFHNGTLSYPNFADTDGSIATGINSVGDIVGWSWRGQTRAVFYSRGKLRKLGTLGGDSSAAFAINDHREIVGRAEVSTNVSHAFLYRDGKMQDLGTLEEGNSKANAINNATQIVGRSDTSKGFHAFLWNEGKLRDLGTLGGDYSEAKAINEAGHIVGAADTGTKDRYRSPIMHACLWKDRQFFDLGTLGGEQSEAYSLNNKGEIVGEAQTIWLPIFCKIPSALSRSDWIYRKSGTLSPRLPRRTSMAITSIMRLFGRMVR